MKLPRSVGIFGLAALGVALLLLAYVSPIARGATASSAGSARPTPAASSPRQPSLYRLRSRWLTDDERSVQLTDLRGNFQVLALMFTRCPTVCPTLVRELHRLEQRMPARVAAATRFTLVSIDPEHDTPAALREYRKQLGLAAPRWTLLRGEPDVVRELGATLGFSFATEDGLPSAHSKLVTLLGREGQILHQQAGLANDPDRIIQLIEEAL